MSNEEKWREESLIEFESYMLNTEEDSSELHRTYLRKIVDICKTLKTNFKFEVNICAGISYMMGYLTARNKAQIEIEGFIAGEKAADAEIERLRSMVENSHLDHYHTHNDLMECRALLRRFLPKDESDWDQIIQLTQTEKYAIAYFRGKDVKCNFRSH